MEHLIYGLFDPRNQELRYVGYTSKTLKERLKDHIWDKGNETPKRSWIKSLKNLNLRPEIAVIDKTNEEAWKEDEKWNIQYWRFLGARLTNFTPGGEGGATRTGAVIPMETRKTLGPNRKTTEEQDVEINEKYWVWGFTPTELAKIFRVSRYTIHAIVRGRRNSFDKQEPKVKQRKLTEDEVFEIKERHEKGQTQPYIVKIMNLNLSNSVISNVVNNKNYKRYSKQGQEKQNQG